MRISKNLSQLFVSFFVPNLPTKKNEYEEKEMGELYGLVEKLRLEEVEYKGCVICLEDIKVGSYAGRLRCLHVFHVHCLKRWLDKRLSCPFCRYELYSTTA
ncbi:hypothetical protein UlMin_041156 [Ulmus minor]